MTIEISSDESAEKGMLACEEVAKILGTAIGRRDETEIEYLFDKIYETVDWQKPDVLEDAA